MYAPDTWFSEPECHQLKSSQVIFNWLTTAFESNKPFVAVRTITSVTSVSLLQVFSSFSQNLESLHPNNNNTRIKRHVNNPKASGYPGDCDERSAVNCTLLKRSVLNRPCQNYQKFISHILYLLINCTFQNLLSWLKFDITMRFIIYNKSHHNRMYTHYLKYLL